MCRYCSQNNTVFPDLIFSLFLEANCQIFYGQRAGARAIIGKPIYPPHITFLLIPRLPGCQHLETMAL